MTLSNKSVCVCVCVCVCVKKYANRDIQCTHLSAFYLIYMII